MARTKILDAFIEAPLPPKGKRFYNDLSGQTFGRLTVVSFAGTKSWKWNCLCECGNKVAVTSGALRSDDTMSCGCLHSEMLSRTRATHGAARGGKLTQEYIAYCQAQARCTNPNVRSFHNYGGRNIEFRFESFQQFLDAVGEKPTPLHTLDRIDVNGHYKPGNVRWATRREQMRNVRYNRLLTVDGVTRCVAEWAEMQGMKAPTLAARVQRYGWCDLCAVTIPVGTGVCPHKGHFM